MNPKNIAGILCFFIVLITGIVLFAVSFSVVRTTEYGIVYDHNWQEIKTGYKDAGRYLLGLGKGFITYPRTMNLIEFSNSSNAQADKLWVYSSDGVSIYLDVSFYFRLIPEKLHDLFFEYGENWYAAVVRHSAATIQKKARSYTADQYLTARPTITLGFGASLQAMFVEKFLSGAELDPKLVQLLQITFDADYEDALLAQLKQKQQKNSTEISSNSTYLNKLIELSEVNTTNKIAALKVASQVEAQKELEVKKAQKFSSITKQYAESYKFLTTLDTPATASQTLYFIYATELGQIPSPSTISVGVKSAEL